MISALSLGKRRTSVWVSAYHAGSSPSTMREKASTTWPSLVTLSFNSALSPGDRRSSYVSNLRVTRDIWILDLGPWTLDFREVVRQSKIQNPKSKIVRDWRRLR